ncbi:F-box protein SKP2A-like [Zootermopsis nevadensis]|uniref:F-box/LRR-repeat protein 2 n=1 Tax=Zootermopsis nevadensis TaxID=136037 RepID=A0A067QQJ4_ZOONE|nr:F-box protein SKP2A-like [Zootermopsis nevadensis]KDR11567.1 F-box/LRR-repeat protein 2 [Zootermopsis nevadensis]
MSPVSTGQQKSLNDFPDEMLLEILSYFGPEDLCLIISKVCERWNALTRDRTLWKSLSLKCNYDSEFMRVVQVLTDVPALHSFNIYGREDAAQLLEFLFDTCDYLNELILQFCNLGEDSTRLLTDIVAFYPDLEVLVLKGCKPLTDAGYSLIPRLQKLSGLNLSHCKDLTGKTVCDIVESCQNLKKLNLDDVTKIFDDDVICIIRKVGGQLTSLILDGEDLTDVAFSYLNNCARLQQLEVSFCEEMTDKGLLEGIGPLQELRSLRLKKGQNLTASGLSTFLHRPAMACIVDLNLSECSSLDDHGLEGIANRCVQLRNLSLCWCWEVTDAGIMILVTHCSELRVLDLLGVIHITGTGYFELVPSHLPHLERLNLEQCSYMCGKYLEELVAAVPELEVIDYYGDRVVPEWNESRNFAEEDDT